MDSELQIGLIALGIAAVVGILAYNKGQESKHRKLAESTFRTDHPDVLLDEPPRRRIEPSLDGEVPDEQGLEPAGDDDQPSGRHALPPIPRELDPRVDCIICIEAIEQLDIARFWAAQSEQLRDLSKAVRWYGFDDGDNHWHPLTPHSAGDYHWLCVA